MGQLKAKPLFESLKMIADPSIERIKRHLLVDILVIAVCAVICGAESWEQVAEFGRVKQEWFSRFLKLPYGIASHDTFQRIFLLLKAEELERVFLEWARSSALTARNYAGRTGVDKKKACEWFRQAGVVLDQVRTAEKSNEITAIRNYCQCRNYRERS